MLTVLAEAGFTGRQRDIANRSLMVYLVGSIQFEHFGQLSETGAAAMTNLPWDQYPAPRGKCPQDAHPTADQEFQAGLNVVLDGLEALLMKTHPG